MTNEEGEEEKIEGDVSSNIQELEKVHETGTLLVTGLPPQKIHFENNSFSTYSFSILLFMSVGRSTKM